MKRISGYLENFARAFKSIHGVAPTMAKDKGSQLKAYPCMPI